MSVTLHHGDSRDVLASLPPDSIDACVTDPPYMLHFMGKAWDDDSVAGDKCFWAEVLRVLKPGAHLLAFSGTRTYHRMACAIEDAGFEIRDQLQWLYGSGFPKSRNLPGGLGTALKPANEPICLARKPIIGTVAANVAQWGTGALNIDASRIATDDALSFGSRQIGTVAGIYGKQTPKGEGRQHAQGRWPANVLFDEVAAAELDRQSGYSRGSSGVRDRRGAKHRFLGDRKSCRNDVWRGPADSGGASRFFYVAKASPSERQRGCDSLPLRPAGAMEGNRDGSLNGKPLTAANHHPTVKPIRLMTYLVRLITPPGGMVLDPFLGSGSTGVACVQEGFGFIGIERETDYFTIAEARIAAAQEKAHAHTPTA